jgi:hypothetical protein
MGEGHSAGKKMAQGIERAQPHYPLEGLDRRVRAVFDSAMRIRAPSRRARSWD